MRQFLHADAVLRAFAATGKRHLLLTGGRGTGKSTLAAALSGMLGAMKVIRTKISACHTDASIGKTGSACAVCFWVCQARLVILYKIIIKKSTVRFRNREGILL